MVLLQVRALRREQVGSATDLWMPRPVDPRRLWSPGFVRGSRAGVRTPSAGLADGHHPPLYFEAPAVLVLVGQVLELSARDQRGAALTFVAGLVLGSAPSRTTRRERGTR